MQLNDSLSNCSSQCLMYQENDLDLFFQTFFLMCNSVFGLPVNVWAIWLICRATRDQLAMEVFLLSLAVCQVLYCLTVPAQLYCLFGPGGSSHGYVFWTLELLGPLLWCGGAAFQACICVDRYMAVIHPLTFIRLKPLKYRAALCAVSWCYLFVTVSLLMIVPSNSHLEDVMFASILCVFLYCSLAVLFSLWRPGPGERKTCDQGKRKAFNLILIHLACFLVNYLPVQVTHMASRMFYIPHSFVSFTTGLGLLFGHLQPLLFLRRAGKLPCLMRAPA